MRPFEKGRTLSAVPDVHCLCLHSKTSLFTASVSCRQNPTSYCNPYITNQSGLPIAPCGAVANSMFNGTQRS